MAIPITSFNGALADLQDHGAGIVIDRANLDERRLKTRYPMELRIWFRSLCGSARVSGAGRTINMSSGGVLVFSEHVALHQFGVGARLQMSIEWPFLLDDKIPLQFFALGRILRRGVSTFVATLDRHQFRTMRAHP